VKPLFLCRVKTQFDNLGDALINRELFKICAEHGSVVVCTSGVPGDFLNWLRLSDIPKVNVITRKGPFFLQIVNSIILSVLGKRRVYIVQNPGGYIGEISSSALVVKRIKAIFISMLRRFGVRSILLGASYEGLGVRNLVAVKLLSEALSVHAVRDNESRDYCQKNGIFVSGVLPDLAFNVSFTERRPTMLARTCIVSLRDPKDSNYCDAIVGKLRRAYQTGCFESVLLTYQVQRDGHFMESFREMLLEAGVPVERGAIPLLAGIEENLSYYSSAGLVVSNRLHVLLLAWRAGTPAIAVVKNGDNKKIVGIYEDTGFGEFCLRSDDDPEALSRLIARIDNEESLSRFFRAFDASGEALRRGFTNMLNGQVFR
jgi:polysaccharide pyruvyl transferase WcaK-like protein